MKITKEDRLLCLFMSIGDGCIHKNGYLSITHSQKQLEYIEWKRILIKKLLTPSTKLTSKYRMNGLDNEFHAYSIRTRNYRFLKLYRKFIYRPKKTISLSTLKKMTPLGLYIWYMDDGGMSRLKLRSGLYSIKEVMLNTGLQKNENQVIIDYFQSVWNIKFSQVKNNSVYRLRCGKKEGEKFLNIFKQYHNEVKSMIYKINPNSY